VRHTGLTLTALGVVALAALTSTGCIFTGGSPSRAPLANSPKGVAGVVAAASDMYEGELLTVTRADLTLRTSERVVVIPYSLVDSGGFSAIDVHIVGAPSQRNLEQLRYASRYPYGVPDSAMRAILAKMGRSAPDTARAP
jgi:hypothetical protein